MGSSHYCKAAAAADGGGGGSRSRSGGNVGNETGWVRGVFCATAEASIVVELWVLRDFDFHLYLMSSLFLKIWLLWESIYIRINFFVVIHYFIFSLFSGIYQPE